MDGEVPTRKSLTPAGTGSVPTGKNDKEATPMKIAISSTGPELHDLVDPRFGRCRYYIFYDVSTGLHASKENTADMH